MSPGPGRRYNLPLWPLSYLVDDVVKRMKLAVLPALALPLYNKSTHSLFSFFSLMPYGNAGEIGKHVLCDPK